MKLLLLCIGSWLAGLAGYMLALEALYGQTVSRGDLLAIAVWTGPAFLLAVPPAYLPGLLCLRSILHGTDPAWPFPLLAVLLSIVPVELISLIWTGQVLPDLDSAEFRLFFCMFATAGLVFGLGFVRLFPGEIASSVYNK